MTTTLERFVTCALCGRTNLIVMLGSTIALGPTDLDSRPAELARSTIHHWIQQCSSCGYCAESLEEQSDVAREVMASDEYRGLLLDQSLPELARQFLCASLILADGEEARAAEAALHAAWACDDALAATGAQRCRRRAAELLVEAHGEGDELMPDPTGRLSCSPTCCAGAKTSRRPVRSSRRRSSTRPTARTLRFASCVTASRPAIRRVTRPPTRASR